MSLDRRAPMSRGSKPMNRGSALERKTPMPTGRPPTRDPGSPLGGQYRSSVRPPAKYPERTASPVRRDVQPADKAPAVRPVPKKAPAARATGFSTATRLLIDTRDRGLCVRCGAPATDVDHRSGRGAGGRSRAVQARQDTPAWGLTLCGQGNTSGCHGWKESAPLSRTVPEGYRIRRNGPDVDAATVPVWTRDGWALFHDDGTRTPCNPPEEDVND